MRKWITILVAITLLISNACVAGATEEKVILELWHYYTNEHLDSPGSVFARQIDEYNDSQDRIHVNCTFVSRQDLMKQYSMGALSGELPDIGMVDNPDMASFIKMGIFEDITDRLNEWGERDQFFAGPMKSCTQEDRIYGLPHNSNCLALYYDKDMLESTGKPVPTTWSELREVAKLLTDPKTGRYGLGISATKDEQGCFQFMPWFLSAGGTVENVNNEGGVKALTFLNDLILDGSMPKDVINWTQADCNSQFVSGNVAMQVNGPWNVTNVKNLAPDKNWGVALIPMADGFEYASVLGGENFGITTACEHMDEAFEFLTWMMSKDVSADTTLEIGKFSSRIDSSASKEVWVTDPIWSVFTEGLKYAQPRGPHPRWPEISSAISVAEHEVFTGVSDAQTALDKANATISAILAE